MKLRAITAVNVNGLRHDFRRLKSAEENQHADSLSSINDLKSMPCYYPVSFTSSTGINNVRKLFQYGIPDMYSERILIDPKLISKWVRSGVFSEPITNVLELFDKYSSSFIEQEKEVIDLLKARAKVHPDWTMKQILQEVRPAYNRKLRKIQNPVFQELIAEFKVLPKSYQDNLMDLLHQTDNMMNDKPVTIPFSALEFRYKLIKIREIVDTGNNKKAKNAMNKILKESMRFANKTTQENLESQKEVLGFLHQIFKKSPLKYNEQLKELLEVSKSRLAKQETRIPFKRKSFIYDLEKIVHDLKHTNPILYKKICDIANKLPTSDDEISAYILKLANETNDSIGYKLVWPSMATIEHLWPRSRNGLNILPNVAIASAKENSGRKSIDFTEQLVRRPKTPIYLQRQMNKLIQLNNGGFFYKHDVSKDWLFGMSRTIYNISDSQVRLDLSKIA